MTTTFDVHAANQVCLTTNTFANDVTTGLGSHPKTIPQKYLYDERGSRLFQEITQLPEYYPTNCELEILAAHGSDIAQVVAGYPFRIIELGAGCGEKTHIFLKAFLDSHREVEYLPIDICPQALSSLATELGQQFASAPLRVSAYTADYNHLSWLKQLPPRVNFVFFPGSNIGNFNPTCARRFLRQLSGALVPSDFLLVGFDLKKSSALLEPAYDDSQGTTREFNFNLLQRLNRELGANFDRTQFVHRSFYNQIRGRMESWLVSTVDQEVAIDALTSPILFAAHEGIHIESSYKYTSAMIKELACSCGFTVRHNFSDHRKYFIDSLWQVN